MIRATSLRTGSNPEKNDRFGGIVYDKIHAGSVFERAYITSFSADDPTFHIVVGKVDDRNGDFRGVIDGATLNRHRDDVLRFFVRLFLRLSLDFANGLNRVAFRFVFEIVDKNLFRFVAGHLRDLFEFCDDVVVSRVHFCLFFGDFAFAIGKIFLCLFCRFKFFVESVLFLFEDFFLLSVTLFRTLQFVATIFHLAIEFDALTVDFLFRSKRASLRAALAFA